MELRFQTGHCCACSQFKHNCTVAEKCHVKEPISHYGKSSTSLVSTKVEMVRQRRNLREILKSQDRAYCVYIKLPLFFTILFALFLAECMRKHDINRR